MLASLALGVAVAVAIAPTAPEPAVAPDLHGLDPLDVVVLEPSPLDPPDPDSTLAVAKDMQQAGQHRRCAEILTRFAVAFPKHPAAAEALAIGARCAETVGLVGMSLHLRERLLDEYRGSTLDAETLRDTATMYETIARYERAAELHARFAAKYSGTEDARWRAVVFFQAVGRTRDALEQVRRPEPLAYKGLSATRRAELEWSVIRVYTDPAMRDSLLKRYLEVHAEHGGPHRRVIAHAARGLYRWSSSCFRPLPDGSCLRVTAAPAPSVCAEVSAPTVTQGTRESRSAAAAQEHFAEALRIADELPPESAVDETLLLDFREAVGAAMFHQIEPAYEAFAAQSPTNPDAVADSLGDLAKGYASLLPTRSPTWVLAGAYRSARAMEHAARLTAPDCATAEAHVEAAEQLYEYCIAKAAELQFFTDDVKRCDANARRLDPEEFPPLLEMVGTARFEHGGPQRVGVITSSAEAYQVGKRLTRGPADSP